MSCVSVVIPAKNRAALVERAVRSVLSQTLSPLEIILVDDGSQPALQQLLPQNVLASLTVIRHDTSQNAAVSRNAAAAVATGDVLAFLDSDDVWQAEHLHLACEALKQMNKALYITPNDESSAETITQPYDYVFLAQGDFRTSGLVMHRSVFEANGGFDPTLEKHQDWDFCFRAAEHATLLKGADNTVFLDIYAENRMSDKPNIAASRYFYAKHASSFSDAHKAVFFSGILRACVLSTSWHLLPEFKSWAVNEMPMTRFDRLAKLCWYQPFLGYLVLILNEYRRKCWPL